MIIHNIKVSLRNLMRYKVQNTICILSLTAGMVCFALSALWLRYENCYNDWWPEKENVYMLQYSFESGYCMEYGYIDHLNYPDGKYLAEKNPQIELFARIQKDEGKLRLSPESEHYENVVSLNIDENVQKMLGIKVLSGRKRLKLRNEETALTRSMAEKLFPDKNAIGQKVWFQEYNDKHELTVVAIIDDPQTPSSFPYQFLKGIDETRYNTPYIASTNTFVRVKPENVASLEKNLEKVVRNYKSNTGYDSQVNSYKLLPLDYVHEKIDDVTVKQNHLKLFVTLGIIVICCALFYYFIILITRIRIRQRELALRYVNGATLRNLICLVATELLIIITVTTLLGLGVVGLVLEDFKSICNIHQPDSFFIGWFLFYALAIVVASLIITAVIVYFCNRRYLYEALDKRKHPTGRTLLGGIRGGLLVLQLAVSIGAVFCASVMMNQIHYLMASPDMGFSKHNRGVINIQDSDYWRHDQHHSQTLEKEVRQWPEVEEILMGYPYPYPFGFQSTLEVTTTESDTLRLLIVGADEHYLRFMELQLVDGEFFSSKDDHTQVCINESAAKLLSDQGKVGGEFTEAEYGNRYVIKGIVKDLAYLSPTTPTQPIAFLHQVHKRHGLCLIRWAEGTDRRKLKQRVEEAQSKLFDKTDVKLDFTIAEEMYDKFILSERNLCRLLTLVTSICVLIAVFGVFSMVSLACERRRKEIAIRKVHGAKTGTIIRMFLREHICQLLTAAFLAFPVGYYLMHLWLMQYVKQAPIYWWIYPSIIIVMGTLIFLTVIWKICKAANENPANVMKSE